MTDISKSKSAFQFTKPILKEVIFVEAGGESGESNNFLQTNVSEIENKDNERSAHVSLTLSNFEELESNEITSSPYLLRVTMEAKFKWNSELINEELESNLLRINAPSLLLSYIRPVVSELTVASAYQEEIVPFIDFTQNNRYKEDR
ncbi:protein-export chaperone SecB [Streptococcus mutans]|uniref:protein-export chaperone SecB n=1 Tax=Streptococcus mutans TaxID=1309 RepID=UPI000264ECDB|nr:protein-export chaperone SecB [Streptococcus mutans]EMB86482.1 hypothetical protein SMU54_02730 [Streptococcus mutans A9]EMC08219.1 hypothetical protein SMU70_00025 [Streptococcus mutans NLML5]EMC11769.1 hypothetical protein SMU74_05233 [Streptococcus mutans M2A]EMC50265.1 hypothetical protein SMU102_04924 [Streptococcus mutans S1B]EMC50585.1 hypothetical protein SMU104_06007 [Streptococcus mutans SA41]